MAVRCRGRSLAFSLLLPIAALAGCGPGAEEVDPTGTARAAGAGPVVVDHVYGTTRVESVPERIVTIDLQWTDGEARIQVSVERSDLLRARLPPYLEAAAA
jgi:ABC-type enterochelin transport system substrate-binding protein